MIGKMDKLTQSALSLIRKAEELRRKMGHDRIGLNHLLLVTLESYGGMVKDMTELDVSDLNKEIWSKLHSGEVGEEVKSEQIAEEAIKLARERGRDRATERDVIAVVLRRIGYRVRKRRQLKSTPTLEKFGRDLCKEAREGKFRRLVGRARELEAIIETLLRPIKRNPLLVGPAGVGKTAIVEGLAQRVVNGEMPDRLKDIKIFALQPSSLVAGIRTAGTLEERMKAIIKEAGGEGIILFIDEIHTVIGAGGMPGLSDIASMLKPALSRGDFVCIGATTDVEYEKFIRPDPALERRFLPIRIQELTPQQTIEVLQALCEDVESERGIKIEEGVIPLIVELSERFLKNRYFPDKAIDILDQCVGSASARGESIIERKLVEEVMERVTGMSIRGGPELSETLQNLAKLISEMMPIEEEALEELVQRLNITMRGLDIRPERPNAVILFLSEEEIEGVEFARLLSEKLFGTERIIEEDMTRYKNPSDISWMTGAPPGYVGHDQPLSLHLEISQTPWSVILFRNVDAAHPSLHRFLSGVLERGFITDSHGRKAFLSDSIIIMTSSSIPSGGRRLGFGAADETMDKEEILKEVLGEELGRCVDLVIKVGRPDGEWLRGWMTNILLPMISERYKKEGIEIMWDESLINWALTLGGKDEIKQGLEKNLGSCLVSYLGKGNVKLKIKSEDGELLAISETKEV